MKVTMAVATDLDALTQFLVKINRSKTANFALIGENEQQLRNWIRQNFLLENEELAFAIMKNSRHEVVAALGLTINGRMAEVWGPFNTGEGLSNESALWQFIKQQFVQIEQFHFFIHSENKQQQRFLQSIQALKTGEHYKFSLTREAIERLPNTRLRHYESEDFQSFKQLHQESFPSTDANAETIISRLDEEQILFILAEEAHVIGYVYIELNKLAYKANLLYIAMHTQFQNKGAGTKLLRNALAEIFKFEEVNTVFLTVATSNQPAIRIYEKVGFRFENKGISYTIFT